MTKEQKDKIVANVKGNIDKADAVFLTNIVGITANDAVALRKQIREAKGHISIARNTLLARAAKGTYAEGKISSLSGPSALAFSFEDPAAIAKILKDFSATNEVVKLKAGYLGTKEITAAEIQMLASLPSRDQMLGTLLATFMAPAAAFVRVLHAIKEQKETQTTVNA